MIQLHVIRGVRTRSTWLSRYLLLACLVSWFIPAICFAQQRIGISAFGIMSKNFQGGVCQTFLRTVNRSPSPAIAVLYGTFGYETACLKRFWRTAANQQKDVLTEFHFSNEFARRANFFDDYDFMSEYTIPEYNKLLKEMPAWLETAIRERVHEILDLVQSSDATGEFLLSTGLEDNYSLEAFNNLYRVIAEEWPYGIVRNPALTTPMIKQRFRPPTGLYIEKHGYTRKFDEPLCVANGDGQDLLFLKDGGREFRHAKPAPIHKVKRWISRGVENGCVMFLWAGKWQGYLEGQSTLPRPLSRTFKFDKEDITVIDKLLAHSRRVARKLGLEP